MCLKGLMESIALQYIFESTFIFIFCICYLHHEKRKNSQQSSRTVKKVCDIPVPSRDVTNQTLPGGAGGNNLIIPAQTEFTK
jgi:hypothetical protein